MSLRGFHFIFISIATILAALVAVWVFFLDGKSEGSAVFVIGIVSALTAVVLPIYGVSFYRKSKQFLNK